MMQLRLRGRKLHVDYMNGREHIARGTLGTCNRISALHLIHRLEIALAEGPRSLLWSELGTVIPPRTFSRFARIAGVPKNVIDSTWVGLRSQFECHLNHKFKLGKLGSNSIRNYAACLAEFESFLKEQEIMLLHQIDESVIERFAVWRIERIKKHRGSDGMATLALEMILLHHLFTFAVNRRLIQNNPVPPSRHVDNPSRGAQPFTGEELKVMRDHAGRDKLVFLVLRWTGFRRSDAITVTWAEFDSSRREIKHVAKKNKKLVVLPTHSELTAALELESQRRNPSPAEPILINPNTGRSFKGNDLYERIAALGKRGGVSHAHPHRFRDTFAVDMLLRGATEYYVANLLGDTLATVLKHYTPFVRELRERARLFMDNASGLE